MPSPCSSHILKRRIKPASFISRLVLITKSICLNYRSTWIRDLKTITIDFNSDRCTLFLPAEKRGYSQACVDHRKQRLAELFVRVPQTHQDALRITRHQDWLLS